MRLSIRSAVFLIADYNGKIPLIKRTNTGFMDGYWSLTAGRLEPDESLLTAVIREAREEAGINVKKGDVELAHICDRFQEYPPKYEDFKALNWIDVYFYVKNPKDKPINNEPHLHSELKMFPLNDLPTDLAPYQAAPLKEYLNNKIYSEYGFK